MKPVVIDGAVFRHRSARKLVTARRTQPPPARKRRAHRIRRRVRLPHGINRKETFHLFEAKTEHKVLGVTAAFRAKNSIVFRRTRFGNHQRLLFR